MAIYEIGPRQEKRMYMKKNNHTEHFSAENQQLSRKLIWLSLIAIIIVPAATKCQSDSSVIEMRLRSEIVTTRERITVGDVADLAGGSQVLRQRLARLDLEESHGMESETLISRRRIIYRLQLAGWDPGTVQVTGAEAVRVRWCGNAQAVEIPASYAATPAKPLSLASPGKPDQTSKSTCPGSNIEDAQALVSGGSDISGTGQPRNSYPGNIMRPASEGSGIVVKKGEWVRLIARVGPLEISTRGEALADGKLGQVIPVRNTESKQTIQARIIRPATCQVDY